LELKHTEFIRLLVRQLSPLRQWVRLELLSTLLLLVVLVVVPVLVAAGELVASEQTFLVRLLVEVAQQKQQCRYLQPVMA
jgi:hypothetical protein